MSVIPFDRDPRPVIDITVDYYGECRVIQRQIMKLLLATGQIFKHDGRLVRIIRQTDSAGTFTRLEPVSGVYMRALVSTVARFQRINARNGRRKDIGPPSEIISGVMNRYNFSKLPFPDYVEPGS
jgi:hypothetical protein